jgi:beta-glucanase (GH16 family)
MSNFKTTALIAALVLSLASAQSSLAPVPADPAWTLLWSDEFNGKAGTQPSEKSWTYELGNEEAQGWGNRELEYYTKGPQNVRLDGQGNLEIRALTNKADLWCFSGDACPYTSARLKTQGKVELKYGKIEARILVPAGAGMWPAFWMLGSGQGGWPRIGEIDVMEWLGRTPTTVYGTLHGPGYSADQGLSTRLEVPTPVSNAFHTFTVVKRPNEIVWLLDGKEYKRVTSKDIPAGTQWVFEAPFYLLLNLAVGGNFAGPVGKDTAFPGVMKVDYVRVWKSKNS